MIDVYREPNTKILSVGHSLISDKGQLRKAITDSNGDYLFSEVGAGIKPLAVIGNLYEITDFLVQKKDKKIVNTIKALPNIYMSISKYTPGERFARIAAIGDIVQTLTQASLDYVPGHTITDFLGNAYTFMKTLKDTIASSKKPPAKMPNTTLYLQFSYIQSDNAILLGKGTVFLSSALYKIYGVKETRV